MAEQETRYLVDHLQSLYVEALDDRDMHRWLACFDQEAGYSCISRENVEGDLPVALMMDDTRARLVDRVKFITEVWAGAFEDYSTRHFVQPLRCQSKGPIIQARSNFLVCFTNERGQSDVLVNGVYEDEICITSEGPRFKSKRAILDTSVTPRYLVYPI